MFFKFMKRARPEQRDTGTDPEVTAALQGKPLEKRKTPPYPHVVTYLPPTKKQLSPHK